MRTEPLIVQSNRMPGSHPIGMRTKILLICQVLPYDNEPAGLQDADETPHTCIRVLNMIEYIQHDREIEVVVLVRQILKWMVVQVAFSRSVHLVDKCHLKLNVGANQRIGKEQVFRNADFLHQAHVRVRAAPHFNYILSLRGKKLVVVKAICPPLIAVITHDQSNLSLGLIVAGR